MSYTNINKDTINTPVHRWNCNQVQTWLTVNRMTAFIDVFKENNVDGRYLLELSDHILEDIFSIKSCDDRLKILSAKNRLAKGIFSIDEKAEKYILYKEKQHTLSRKHSNEDNNKLTVPKVYPNLNKSLSSTALNDNKQLSVTIPKHNADDSIIGLYTSDIYVNSGKNYAESTISTYVNDEKIIHITKCPYGVVKHTKTFNIEGICDSKSLMKTILKEFDIEEPINFWDLYVNEEGSPLTEREVSWICNNQNTKIIDHNHFYLKRNDKMKYDANFKPRTKLEQIFGVRDIPVVYVQRKLQKCTNERPPSEQITSNMNKYFSGNNRKSLKMIYDEDSDDRTVVVSDNRSVLSGFNNDGLAVNPSKNDKYCTFQSAMPYANFNNVDHVTQLPLDRLPVKNVNNEKFATIERIPSVSSKLENVDRIPLNSNKFATVERTCNFHTDEKDVVNNKNSPTNERTYNYRTDEKDMTSNNKISLNRNLNNCNNKSYLSEHIPNNKYNQDSSGRELYNRSLSRPAKRSGSNSRSRHPSNDRYRGDRHTHRHRINSPSTERYNRRQYSYNNNVNASNSNNNSNNQLVQDDNFNISVRKSSLNNPFPLASSKTHTNSPLAKSDATLRKLNGEASSSIIVTSSSPKSIPSSTSHSPVTHSPYIHHTHSPYPHSPHPHSPYLHSPISRSPISHSPKKHLKEKESIRDKEKEYLRDEERIPPKDEEKEPIREEEEPPRNKEKESPKEFPKSPRDKEIESPKELPRSPRSPRPPRSPRSPRDKEKESQEEYPKSPKSPRDKEKESPRSPKSPRDKEKESPKESPKSPRDKEKVKQKKSHAPIKWKKGALIGSGSYGEVYLGMNQSNGELMAIKQVEFKENSKDNKFVQSLMQEIDILKDLQHKNIVQYYGSQSDENYFNIFLEYVPGGSILSLLNNYGAFEELLIKNFIRQVLEGVAYLHEKGIVHRDIKGANILVDNKGIVKISDFGISRKVDENSLNMKSKMNNRTSFNGSIYWMAPEVIKQMNYTGKSDIWSIGCLVIEMFTAKHPWEQLDQTAAIFKIGSNNKPPIPEGLSFELNDFVTRTFELNFVKRPSAKKLLTHKFIVVPDENNSEEESY